MDQTEIMKNQPTINIGMIGHVSHGKSSVVRAITGVNTIKSKAEKERNITIKLGYANAKIFKCDNPECPVPQNYCSYASSQMTDPPCKRENCSGTMRLVRHVSFIDCPGHDVYMATMISGTAVMDAAFLLVASNEVCPQPQTSEHLAAVEVMQLKNIIVLQNKIDLIKKQVAKENYEQIRSFMKGTSVDKQPIIPISAQYGLNIDMVCCQIVESIPEPSHDTESAPLMSVIRSFDVNKPGTDIMDMVGGVLGGTITKGIFKVGDEIEMRPGLISKNGDKISCQPLQSKIVSLHSESNVLSYAIPGGLIGVGTDIDPYFCRSDRLIGQIIGLVGKMPPIVCEFDLKYLLLKNLLGVKGDAKITPLTKAELLLLTVGTTSTSGRIIALKGDRMKIKLEIPVCCDMTNKIALSRKINNNYRLIGWGEIMDTVVYE